MVGDVAQHRLSLAVDGHLAAALSDIAPVGVGHLAGTVDYAAHDRDDNSLEVRSACLDFGKGLLQVVHRAAAARAGDVLGLVETAPCGLHYLVGQIFRHSGGCRNLVDLALQQLRTPFYRRVEHFVALEALGQIARDRKFVLGRLGQGDSDGVAYAFLKQGGYAYAGLDSGAVATSGLGHAEMQGEHMPLLAHHLHELPVGLGHDDGVARLERNDHAVEFPFDTHLHPFHRGGRHREGRVAVALGDVASQRAVVEAYAYGGPVFAAYLDEPRELLAGLVVVAVEVTGVDAHLLHLRSHRDRGLGREVDVGAERHPASRLAEPAAYLPDVLHVVDAGHCDAYEARPRFRKPEALGDRGVYVIGVGVAHGLYDYRRISAHDQGFTYSNRNCLESFHKLFRGLSALSGSWSFRHAW